MKSYAFIYNPAAGGNSAGKVLALENKIKEYENIELFQSQTIGDISNFIDRRLDDFDVFVACGGDGTIREIASKLMYTDKKMGIIPMGTGNDLCKTLRIPQNFSEAFDLILKGDSLKIDIGRCNNFIFLNSLGFGFDGLTNKYANRLKHLHPFLCYAISALKAVLFHQSFTVVIKSNDYEVSRNAIMISLANGRVEGGSFWIAPKASITDGKLNCITIRPITKWLIPILLPLFLFKKPHLIPQVISEEKEGISLSFSKEVDIHADGEIIESNSDSFSITLIPKALDVISKL